MHSMAVPVTGALTCNRPRHSGSADTAAACNFRQEHMLKGFEPEGWASPSYFRS